jgi:hypothetical protein
LGHHWPTLAHFIFIDHHRSRRAGPDWATTGPLWPTEAVVGQIARQIALRYGQSPRAPVVYVNFGESKCIVI